MSFIERVSLKMCAPHKVCELTRERHRFKLVGSGGNRHGTSFIYECEDCSMTFSKYSCASFSSETWNLEGKIIYKDTSYDDRDY